MADLVTHLCSALLPGGLFRLRYTGVFTVGTVVPDLGSRLPGAVLELGMRGLGLPIPVQVFHLFDIFHTPVGVLMTWLIAAFAFPEGHRKRVVAWGLLGSALHFALDLLQNHHGHGYVLFFPFSMERREIGWIGSEATVPFALPLALTTAAVWGVTEVVRRRRRSPTTSVTPTQ